MAADPKEWLAHSDLGMGYEGTGKFLEAASEFQTAVELSGGDQDAMAHLAHAYAAAGNRAQAQKISRSRCR